MTPFRLLAEPDRTDQDGCGLALIAIALGLVTAALWLVVAMS